MQKNIQKFSVFIMVGFLGLNLLGCSSEDAVSTEKGQKYGAKNEFDLGYAPETVELSGESEQFILNLKVPAEQLSSAALVIPIYVEDSEFRQERWHKCGRLLIESCRRWDDIRSLDNNKLEETHLKVQLLLNGAELNISALKYQFDHEQSDWNSRQDNFRSMLQPFALAKSAPIIAAQSLFRISIGKGTLSSERRSIAAKGQIVLQPDLSGLRDEEFELKLVITKTQASGVIQIQAQDI